MTHDEILKALYDETMVGNAPAVLSLTNQGLEAGLTPSQLLFDALIPSLEEVGARFERGDFFVPEMLIAGRAMAGSFAHATCNEAGPWHASHATLISEYVVLNVSFSGS